MRGSSIALALLWSCGLVAQAQQEEGYAPAVRRKRDVMSCEQTYGAGSQRCGGPDSTFCFKPSEGQTCCSADSGYCDKGTYCAPVPGYCCLEGENLETCARNAGFTLPSTAAGSRPLPVPTASYPANNAPAIISGRPSVTPFIVPSSAPSSAPASLQPAPSAPAVSTVTEYASTCVEASSSHVSNMPMPMPTPKQYPVPKPVPAPPAPQQNSTYPHIVKASGSSKLDASVLGAVISTAFAGFAALVVMFRVR